MSDISDTTKEFTMIWKIMNFSYAWLDIASEPFISRCFNNSKFFLKIEHKESKDNNKEIKIYIIAKNRNLPVLDYEVALVTSDGSPEEILKAEQFDFDANNTLFNIFGDRIKETLVVSRKTILEERRKAFLPDDTLTIRCRLLQHKVECATSEEIFVCSTIGVRRKALVWTLDQFSSDQTGTYANLFTAWGPFGRLKLTASIKEESEEIIVEIQRDKGVEIFSTIKLSLLTGQGTVKELISDSFFFEKKDQEQVWQSPPLISKSEIVAEKSKLSPKDALLLKCEFATSLGLVNEAEEIFFPEDFILSSNDFNETCISRSNKKSELSPGSLQSDFRCILDTGSLSDLNLKVDSEVFPVHKAVLGARSPTFNAMFMNDFKEKSSGQVLISDIDADTMRQFLVYIYTDTIDSLSMENATKLYFVADKYEVLCLRRMCASFLKTNLSCTSVCAVLILADLHRDAELKSVAQDFISKHDSEILRSEDWRDLEKSNHLLGLETLREICLKKSTK